MKKNFGNKYFLVILQGYDYRIVYSYPCIQ